jgi:hypothetical protein
MIREDKIKLAIEKGITYDLTTGKIYGVRGNEIKPRKDGYISIGVRDGKNEYKVLGHQFAYYFKYGKVVECIDHINGVRDDNRIENLREVTNQQNQFNTNAKGYHFNKKVNKFQTQITINSKKIHLGYFNTEQEARQAYLEAKEKYHII